MANDKEIEINNTTIGEGSKISLTVKTALWIIGCTIGLFTTILTVGYFDVKSDVADYKKKLELESDAFIKRVEESINIKLDKQRDKDENFIKDIEEIRGNIRLLLDRTQGSRTNTVTESTPTISNNTPSSLPINNNH